MGEFDDFSITKLFDLLSMKIKMHTWSQKSTKQISKSNTQK